MANSQQEFSLKYILENQLQSDEERMQFLHWVDAVGINNLRELHKICDKITINMYETFKGQEAM